LERGVPLKREGKQWGVEAPKSPSNDTGDPQKISESEKGTLGARKECSLHQTKKKREEKREKHKTPEEDGWEREKKEIGDERMKYSCEHLTREGGGTCGTRGTQGEPEESNRELPQTGPPGKSKRKKARRKIIRMRSVRDKGPPGGINRKLEPGWTVGTENSGEKDQSTRVQRSLISTFSERKSLSGKKEKPTPERCIRKGGQRGARNERQMKKGN